MVGLRIVLCVGTLPVYLLAILWWVFALLIGVVQGILSFGSLTSPSVLVVDWDETLTSPSMAQKMEMVACDLLLYNRYAPEKLTVEEFMGQIKGLKKRGRGYDDIVLWLIANQTLWPVFYQHLLWHRLRNQTTEGMVLPNATLLSKLKQLDEAGVRVVIYTDNLLVEAFAEEHGLLAYCKVLCIPRLRWATKKDVSFAWAMMRNLVAFSPWSVVCVGDTPACDRWPAIRSLVPFWRVKIVSRQTGPQEVEEIIAKYWNI